MFPYTCFFALIRHIPLRIVAIKGQLLFHSSTAETEERDPIVRVKGNAHDFIIKLPEVRFQVVIFQYLTGLTNRKWHYFKWDVLWSFLNAFTPTQLTTRNHFCGMHVAPLRDMSYDHSCLCNARVEVSATNRCKVIKCIFLCTWPIEVMFVICIGFFFTHERVIQVVNCCSSCLKFWTSFKSEAHCL